MSLSRAVSSSLRCVSCSSPIARGAPRVGASTFRATFAPSTCAPQRTISSTARRTADRDDPATKDPEFAFLADNETANDIVSEPSQSSAEAESALDSQSATEATATSTESPPSSAIPPANPSEEAEEAEEAQSTQSTLPWYLQNRPAPEPTQAAIIPELPPNPPPLLQTLLEYIANTAGMDDLLLYDLRQLDPPPALGSNLIMLLCTARSEKHLHVSADRFCRYLRREHHLRANAAGLLGRNELKIKLRRKAKRMKMLANVGGAEPEGNIDDGIRTGWICCTVGKIEAHPDDKGVVGARGQGEGFVGFSDVKPGVNVVVQMFTEEKRAETDLETLWGGVLKTHERNEGKADQMIKELEEELEEVDMEAEVEELAAEERKQKEEKEKKIAATAATTPAFTFNKTRPTTGDVFPPADSFPGRQQLRRLHTVGLRG